MSAERAGARFDDGRWLPFAFAAVHAYGAHSYLAVVEDVESPVCGGLSTMGDYLCPGAFRAEGMPGALGATGALGLPGTWSLKTPRLISCYRLQRVQNLLRFVRKHLGKLLELAKGQNPCLTMLHAGGFRFTGGDAPLALVA